MSTLDRARALLILAAAGLLLFYFVRRRKTHPLVSMAFFARFSLTAAAVQFFLGWLALLGFPHQILKSALENVFILDYPTQLCHVTWISLLLATTTIVTYRTTKVGGQRRFKDHRQALLPYLYHIETQGGPKGLCQHIAYSLLHSELDERNVWFKRWFYLAVLGIPIPLASYFLTSWDMACPEGQVWWINWRLGAAILVGIIIWAVMMAAITAVQQLVVEKSVTDFGLFPLDAFHFVPLAPRTSDSLAAVATSRLSGILARFGPGYSYVKDGRTRLIPGHLQLTVYTTIVVVGYAISIIGWSDPATQGQHFPTLVSLMTMALMLLLVASGAAFFFDFWRLPIVLVLVFISLVNWWSTNADSYYEVKTAANLTSGDFRLSIPKGRDGKRTLVIVAAAGGGIQAAAWTTEVLTGLQEIYGDTFTKSVGAVSAVSGGSVGTMFYLDRWEELTAGDENRAKAAIKAIRCAGRRSSLEATAQLWSGWDMVKTLSPFLVPKLRDRGWAIEESWRASLADGDATILRWRQRLDDGRLPVAVFNATVAESGERFVVSNATFPDKSGPLTTPGEIPRPPRQYFLGDDQQDVSVVTAARLSATFPYVSPICKASEGEAAAYHIADGGFFDNEGVFSAIQWLDEFLRLRKQILDASHSGKSKSPFDQVVLVRILPFPPGEGQQMPQLGWLYAYLGPLETMLHVRGASQIARNDFALAATQRTLEDNGIPFKVIRLEFHKPHEQDEDPPLSWKLSRRQQRAIDEEWRMLVEKRTDCDSPFVDLNDMFNADVHESAESPSSCNECSPAAPPPRETSDRPR